MKCHPVCDWLLMQCMTAQATNHKQGDISCDINV